jgi:TonB family protein
MTQDPALAGALEALATGNVTLCIVQDLRRLADELMQHPRAVALLDAQALNVPADAAVDAVKNQFPDVRLMIAGNATEQNLLAGRIADQKVFRFVHKPASPQRLKLFFEAASAQVADRNAAGPAPAPASASAAARPPGGGAAMLPILAAVAGVLALAIGGWLMMREPAEPAGTAPPATAAPVPTPELTSLLERAASAFGASQFIASDGSSAAELYRAALRLDPDNAAASDGFERAIDSAFGSAEQALLANQLEQARVTAELLRLIVPDNSRLEFLYTQIERELSRISADASQREALQARQAAIRAAVEAVEQRIARGALLEPATNSAMSRFREAQAVGGGDPQVRGIRDALVGALLTEADKELIAGRPAAARELIDAAGSVNSSAPGLDFARRRIDEALIRQAATTTAPAPVAPAPTPVAPAAALPQPAAAAGTDPAPADVQAGASDRADAGPSVVSASTLKTLRREAPVYPALALQSLVSGWVELEYTVTTDGSVRDVVVVDSKPRRTFDSAAVSAIKRYRYEPVLRNGVPVEQRASLRMRFTAEDGR